MKTAKVNVCFNQRGGLYESTVCRGMYLLGGRDIDSFDEYRSLSTRSELCPMRPSQESVDLPGGTKLGRANKIHVLF